MKTITVFISVFTIFFLLECRSFCMTEEDDFPKVGFVKSDGVTVRAGDNINFKTLCRLEKGDPVKIIGKRYSWFKIILPKNAYLYIKSDYVDLSSDGCIGVVNSSRVNLRAGPATIYSVLGQVSKPKEICVLEEKDGWYKVEPPDGIAGWIHYSQISFTFEDIERSPETLQTQNN